MKEQVKEMLSRISINLVSDDMKHRMVDEIARTNNLTLEYNSKLHQQQQVRFIDILYINIEDHFLI